MGMSTNTRATCEYLLVRCAENHTFTMFRYDQGKINRKKELDAHREALGEKKAFKSMCHATSYFSSAGEHVAGSSVCSHFCVSEYMSVFLSFLWPEYMVLA